MKRALLAATLLALPMAARAQPIQGLYVGGGAGMNILQQDRVRLHTGKLPGPTLNGGFKIGPAALGSIGWAFGNGVRVEVEGSWRRNNVTAGTAGLSGSERKFGAMANVLFDMDIGSPYVYPYLGAGAGRAVGAPGPGQRPVDRPGLRLPGHARRRLPDPPGGRAVRHRSSTATSACRANGSSPTPGASRPYSATTTTTRSCSACATPSTSPRPRRPPPPRRRRPPPRRPRAPTWCSSTGTGPT